MGFSCDAGAETSSHPFKAFTSIVSNPLKLCNAVGWKWIDRSVMSMLSAIDDKTSRRFWGSSICFNKCEYSFRLYCHVRMNVEAVDLGVQWFHEATWFLIRARYHSQPFFYTLSKFNHQKTEDSCRRQVAAISHSRSCLFVYRKQ